MKVHGDKQPTMLLFLCGQLLLKQCSPTNATQSAIISDRNHTESCWMPGEYKGKTSRTAMLSSALQHPRMATAGDLMLGKMDPQTELLQLFSSEQVSTHLPVTALPHIRHQEHKNIIEKFIEDWGKINDNKDVLPVHDTLHYSVNCRFSSNRDTQQ